MFGTKSFATAESVTCGHPDKACDQVADAVLDAILSNDPEALVGCEVTASPNEVHIMGEITTQANPDYERIARSTLTQIGYTSHEAGFDAATCAIDVDVHGQSPEIVRSVSRAQTDDAGAGDQGVVFGYATNETDSFMPMPIALAHKLVHRMDDLRTGGQAPNMLPDGKAQVSVEYENGVPARVSSVVLSAQTQAACDIDTVREYLSEQVVRPVIPEQLADSRMQLFINPTGRFTVGGPAANTGLSGRKNMVDTYGSAAHSGGSSLAGKDPSKINRSGTYLARYIAKNIVAAGLAKRCEMRMAYAIGLADPVCMDIDTFGTGVVSDERLAQWVQHSIDLRPALIIRRFNLRRPLYRALSCYGNVGANAHAMPWEALDLTNRLSTDLQ